MTLTATCRKCNGSGLPQPFRPDRYDYEDLSESERVCGYCGGKKTIELPTYRTAALGQIYVARARKDHECALCGWKIPVGDHYWTWSLPPYMADLDYWYVGHAHAVCETVYSNSDWLSDDVLPDQYDFRAELLANVVSAERGNVEWA